MDAIVTQEQNTIQTRILNEILGICWLISCISYGFVHQARENYNFAAIYFFLAGVLTVFKIDSLYSFFNKRNN